MDVVGRKLPKKRNSFVLKILEYVACGHINALIYFCNKTTHTKYITTLFYYQSG